MTVWEQVLTEIRELKAQVAKLIEAQEAAPAATAKATSDAVRTQSQMASQQPRA